MKKNRKRKTSSLSEHKQIKKRLDPPLIASLGDTLQFIRWDQELLPEYLWVMSLFREYSFDSAMNLFNETLDLLDPFNVNQNAPLLGTLSSFSLVSCEQRKNALDALAPVYDKAIVQPFGSTLALYPECPAFWLIRSNLSLFTSDKTEEGISRLKQIMQYLLPGDEHSVLKIRGIPLNRLFKHNKLFLFNTLPHELLEGIEYYPNTPHRDLVDSWTKTTTMTILAQRKECGPWAKYFWRHNYKLSPCEHRHTNLYEPDNSTVNYIKSLLLEGERCWKNLKKEISEITVKVNVDIYDPTRDDVLLGLLGRQARFLSNFLTNVDYWTEDIGEIFLRCMVDTLITLSWLGENGDINHFTKFKEYSLGKQKLLKLHLEDKIDSDDKSDPELEIQRLKAQDNVSSEINEELLSIELGKLFYKDHRIMAKEVGLEDEYRFIYSPTSGSIHGEWVSLKKAYLTNCVNPMHRGHYLIDLSSPLLWTGFPIRALSVFKKTFLKWAELNKLNASLEFLNKYEKLYHQSS